MQATKNQEDEAMARVPVNGKVLEWAREYRGLTLHDAARLLSVSSAELHSYETGEKEPLVGFLRKMAQKYRINFASLLMPEPLGPPERQQDHRTRPGSKRQLSLDTLVAIEDAAEALEAFEDIGSDVRDIVPRLRIGKATLRDNPAEVAAEERKRFGVSIAEQHSWRNLADARVKWRRHIEERGVFTYMVPLPLKELSGFSLLRNGLAAICVNDNETTEGAKIFTLFHEYCHLLLRTTGISDNNDRNRVERFCNRFAASFLIPKSDLIEVVSNMDITTPHEFSTEETKYLAKWFRVSNRAIVLRLERTGLAPDGFYRRHTKQWDLPIEPPKPPVIQEKKTQPSQVRIRVKEIGNLHATIVMQAFQHNAINAVDASELVNLKPSTFPKLRKYIGLPVALE